ncbi:phage holin family protein [Solidesulfovibrio sp.]
MLRTGFDYLCGAAQDLLGGYLLKVGGSAVISFACLWIGGLDKMVEGLFYLICLDFALGLAHGWKLGRLSKDKFLSGLAKFLLYFAALLCASLLDTVLNAKTDALWHAQFRDFLIIYFCLHEALSILQHLHFFGVPLPAALIKRLTDYRDCKLWPGRGKAA